MQKHHNCLNTRAIIEYFLKNMPGEVNRLFTGLGPEIEDLADPQEFLMQINNWVSSDVVTKMFENAKAITKDDKVAFKIGFESAASRKLGYIQRIILIAYRNSSQTIKRIQDINDKFNKNKRIELVGRIDGNDVIRLHWFKNIPATIDYCLFNKGIYCGISIIWNLAPAKLEETKCFFKGDEYCEYYIKWPSHSTIKEGILLRAFLPWRRLTSTIAELRYDKQFLVRQVEELQSLNQVSQSTKDIDDFFSNTVIRTIEFAPEHYQAGMSILSYFNKFINNKYPKTDIKVKIEQQGLTVRMIVETASGDVEQIERTLESYGLILRGEMAAEDYLSDPVQILELKQQLSLAYFQIENQKELLKFTDKHYNKRMESLEGEVKWLRGHVGNLLVHSEMTSQAITLTTNDLLKYFGNLNNVIKIEVENLYDKIENGLTKKDELIIKEIFEKLKAENGGAFKQLLNFLKDSVIKGSISGASGHLLYDWIKSFL